MGKHCFPTIVSSYTSILVCVAQSQDTTLPHPLDPVSPESHPFWLLYLFSSFYSYWKNLSWSELVSPSIPATPYGE